MIALVSISLPIFGLYCQELVLPRWHTAMASSMSLGIGIAFIGIGGGFVIVASGHTTYFVPAAMLAIAGTLLFRIYFRKPRGELAGGSAVGAPGSRACAFDKRNVVLAQLTRNSSETVRCPC